MAAVRNNHLPDLPDSGIRRACVPVGRLAATLRVSACRREPDKGPGRDNENWAAGNWPRVAVIAVGVVVPLAVLVLCLCLPRREHVRPTMPSAVEQPLVAVPAVLDAARTSPVGGLNPEAARPKEVPVAPQDVVAAQIAHPSPEQEGKAAGDVSAEAPLPPARVEKPLATIALPARADDVKLPVDPALRPAEPAACESCRKAPAGDYGTALHFARDPTEAARLAKEDNKLMVIFTISGNFEDSKFT
jgi:hypothetical protein